MKEDNKEKGKINVEELMERIRSSVAEKIKDGVYSQEEVDAVRRMELSLKERKDFGVDIDEYISYLHANWDPNGPCAISSHRPFLGKLLVPLKKITRKLLKPLASLILIKQTEFNNRLTRLLTSALPSQRDNFQALDKRFEDLLLQHIELVRRNGEMYRRLEELSGETQRNRDLIGALRHRERAEFRLAAPAGDSSYTEGENFPISYLAFEDRYRGPSAEIKEKQRDYLKYFQGRRKVLDLGCGRGEFLELLSESGIEAYGVDINPEMISLCREKGLRVEAADGLAHLAGLEDSSLGGIFAAQVAEHLTTAQLSELIGLARAKLSAGATLVLETINPACLTTFAGPVYLDPTHIKPIHPEALRFLLEAAGFSSVELVYRSPFPPEGKLKEVDLFHRLQRFEESFLNIVNDNFNQLNQLLYGYQDYAVIAVK